MKAIKLMLVLAVPIVAYQFWTTHQQEQQQRIAAVAASPNGFVPLPAVAGADPRQVIVFAPENCPSDAAQRSDAMARDLMNKSIPTMRSHDVTFTGAPEPGVQDRLNAVMNGELPIVIVNGKGKANPTLDQVVAEYMATP